MIKVLLFYVSVYKYCKYGDTIYDLICSHSQELASALTTLEGGVASEGPPEGGTEATEEVGGAALTEEGSGD